MTARLAWQTPTGALLWELWTRQKRLFISQGVVLLLGTVLVHWFGDTPDHRDFLGPIAYQAGALALLQTLTCFCYMEVDARRLQGGIPGYLFLKPLTTTRLVAVPMLCGGAAVIGSVLLWIGLILRHLGFPTNHLLWTCVVFLSFTWCVQAVVWSSANLNWGAQTLLVLLTALAHLLAALMPVVSIDISLAWRLLPVPVVLAGAFAIAKVGVGRIREGSWEGGEAADQARTSPRRHTQAFGSAFRAQFWLEWHRQGMKLPLFTGLGLVFFILTDAAIQFFTRSGRGDGVPDEMAGIFLNYLIATPIVCSLVLGNLIANFDASQLGNEMPGFVSIRPMSNGDLVLAKLAMAGVSSLATWGVFAIGMVGWLIVCGHGGSAWRAILARPGALTMMLLPSLLVLVLLTWRNLVTGIWVGLTARPRLIGAVTWLRFVAYVGVCSLAARAKDIPEFRASLLDWMPWILGAALAVKWVVSAMAFRVGVRRNAMTRGAMIWILSGWLLAGAFLGFEANQICQDLQLSQDWNWVVLAGFWLMPLSELALAPLALALNRHR